MRKAITAGGVFLTSYHTAQAEVCDKVNRSWSPEDGPVDIFSRVTDFVLSPLGIVIAVLLLAAWMTKWRWLHIVNAALTVSTFFFVSLGWLIESGSGGINQAAIKEGCLAEPLLLIPFLSAPAIWSLFKAITKPKALTTAQ